LTLDDFCKLWSVGGPPPEIADVVGLVSFGATHHRLTYGTQNVVRLGKRLSAIYIGAYVVFGEFTDNPRPSLERSLKMEYLPHALYGGKVISTIEEAEKWRAALPRDFRPKRGVVIATDEMHSRSARRVSNRVWNGWWLKRLLGWFLGTNIPVRVVTFPTRDAIDPHNPMTALREKKIWVRNNVLRELFLMFVPFGFTIMRKLNIHQPTVR
jgi:hypothetical protein